MENNLIQQCVGENIKKFRVAKGLTLDEVAKSIYKSKSTISKYEKGSIAIDIATLSDIANTLDVSLTELIALPAKSNIVPSSLSLVDESYMYSYDGKSKRIIKSVIDCYKTDVKGYYSIQLFYDINDKEHTGECSALYQGSLNKHQIIENYTLQNSQYPIEQIWISSISGLSHTRIQVGFMAGLLNATLLPAVRKIVISPDLMNDKKLMDYLVFSKEEMQNIKKRNIFVLDEFVE